MCSLSMYVTRVSWHTLTRLRFEGAIALFRLCRPLAGMIELKDSDAFGKTFFSSAISSYQLFCEICPAGQSLIPP